MTKPYTDHAAKRAKERLNLHLNEKIAARIVAAIHAHKTKPIPGTRRGSVIFHHYRGRNGGPGYFVAYQRGLKRIVTFYPLSWKLDWLSKAGCPA